MGRIPQKSSFFYNSDRTITVQLTRGQTTIIDDIDFDLLNRKWYARFCKTYSNGGNFQAACNLSRVGGISSNTTTMHRAVMSRMINRELDTTEMVNHVDNDPLNNRRSNLRLSNHSDNGLNRKGKNRNNTSGFMGVTFHKSSGRWLAQKKINGKQFHIGLFATADAAHEAYCKFQELANVDTDSTRDS